MPDRVATESHSARGLPGGPRRRLELLPNCSLTPRAARRVLALCAGSSLAVAALFAANGYWPVLPCAALELALLAVALSLSLKRRHYVQTVEIGATDITITSRGPRGEGVCQFSRHWARVTLRDPRGWQPSRLLIESHGRACEIGALGTEEERRALGRRLAALLARRSALPAFAPAGRDAVRGHGEQ